jgi:hypothetical protein
MKSNRTFYFDYYDLFSLAKTHSQEAGFQVEPDSCQEINDMSVHRVFIKIFNKRFLPNQTLKVITPSLHLDYEYLCCLVKSYLQNLYGIQDKNMTCSASSDNKGINVETNREIEK